MNILREWYHRYGSDPQAVILAVLLATGLVVILTLGQMLAPVLAGVVIAYLLDGVVEKCHRLGMPRLSAVVLVFLLFMSFLVFALLWLVPRLSYQVTELVKQLPDIIGMGQNLLLKLPEKYPNLFTAEQVGELGASIRADITAKSQHILSLSLPAVFGLFSLLVYIILVPVLAFFFLKDKYHTTSWAGSASACRPSATWSIRWPVTSTCRCPTTCVARCGRYSLSVPRRLPRSR
jgi:putative permease